MQLDRIDDKRRARADRRSPCHGRHDTSILIRGKRQWRTQLRARRAIWARDPQALMTVARLSAAAGGMTRRARWDARPKRSVFHSWGLGFGLSQPNTTRYSSTLGPTGECLTERAAQGFPTAACERTAMFNSRHGEFLRGVVGEAIFAVAFAAITFSLSGCSVVGPASIDHGRTSYNEVIEDTSRQQALLNVVRVSKGESPLFIDVTEVDAATSEAYPVDSGGSTCSVERWVGPAR
jgi:hypothetical protein